MAYLSLARKYRPQIFDELIGQEHIATTLKNAISMDTVTHAYLFSGPRGVGKTSTARILAKSLNCEKGPNPMPCGSCPSCVEITKGSSMDVIEIDGASNRGIDEIRNLKENIKFMPLHGKFRIYIIDEVHMLTQEAFNALLKTLEEPPLHVKFFFATTRPYKVLPTIISRCQRFDFRKISAQKISEKLKSIRDKEKLTLTDEAVLLMAKAADGSLRDAEVILDQLLSFAKGKVEKEDVVRALGLLEEDILFGIAGCIIKNDRKALIGHINTLIENGKDPIFIASSVISHFRDLLVVNTAKEAASSYLALSPEEYKKLETQAREISPDEILYIIYTISTAIDLIRKTSLGRIPLEVSLLKLTERGKPGSIKEILEKLSKFGGTRSALPQESPSATTDSAPASGEGNISAEGEASYEDESVKGEPVKSSGERAGIPENQIMHERDILILQKIKNSWVKVLNLIKNKKMSLATFLREGTLATFKDNALIIGFDVNNSLHKEAVESLDNRRFVEDAIENIIGERVRLRVETLDKGPAEEAPVEEEGAGEIDGAAANLDKIEPIVESALDIFEGRVVDIRKKKENKS